MDSGKMNDTDNNLFRKFYSHYEAVISIEKPALLHGDLWSGNFMVGTNGEPCLIDPAVYYGHREMDLSMTKLFGGFDEKFYEAYHAEFPLSPGFDERIEMHNLYPLMVHVNLFGGGYVSQVRTILKRFS
jgi:protein-ribulosamine 3-kinase